MSTELAQDEDDADNRDAEEYDLDALERHGRAKDADDENGDSNGAIRLRQDVAEDNVVFEIGDEEEDAEPLKVKKGDSSDGYELGDDHEDADESKGLMGAGRPSRIDKRMD